MSRRGATYRAGERPEELERKRGTPTGSATDEPAGDGPADHTAGDAAGGAEAADYDLWGDDPGNSGVADQAEREPTAADRLAARLDVWSSQRERREVHFLRYVPKSSPVHNLWAGTKFVCVGALSISLFVWPTWPALAVVAGLLILIVALIRIPASAVPRLPGWILGLVAIGALIALISGGAPVETVAGLRVGVGGIEAWARFAVLAIELLVATTVVGWTTPLAELAPAISRLASPLRRVKVPVDELAVALALSIRCLPLVVEELRTLRDARRSRRTATPRNASEMGRDAVELAIASLLNALRRAAELAAAIEARGGATVVRHDGRRPHRADYIALAVMACAITAMGVLG